ncbi:2-amino-4-hydroxy-6-hydroxymethyldihydropteridine diphosphokinase [Aurantiacibacter sp. D1-12]|uniref:2-amino-4-hydroxy-6- hydroxymethyldihydropteridine diphosphokinase n=1 Tax=Aurantiacibacter sp. D1-12 TaxID=2993658 RepID=UPI00237C99FD|nr:2-amino-4-hydroxy-6-hydroxymethyldihydropteridine diphosphokinase [Aurantiacibacter sp. D1-12]MDE1467518.1 2-amino-4-hydroxy-6-hydroxymethyldihydropteridine diphosphokinase [Aurantiacibacter sp. D1-12]
MSGAHTYLIALGSNQRHPAFGNPRQVVASAMELLDGTAGAVTAHSRIIDSAPVGPSQRRYANAALLLETRLLPPSLLTVLHETEAAFGRVRRGQRWRSRALDLDIVLWSGGIFASPELLIPHPRFRERDFVLGPAAAIAPEWRDPVSGLKLKHLYARLTRHRPAPR